MMGGTRSIVRQTCIQRLSLIDGSGERSCRLLRWGSSIISVRTKDVYIFQTSPAQETFKRRQDMLSRAKSTERVSVGASPYVTQDEYIASPTAKFCKNVTEFSFPLLSLRTRVSSYGEAREFEFKGML